ncbi:LPP20 family lipoprotein [Ideonella livida]|uniref:Lipoprotein LPP20-like domain-containing protein n=1 Tax=Ideonella livida TaxID=2707176 RepID=A0A7C9PFJ1_9BURK|nr:LPP20 family lipoprotein [Ideonella livida]NDY90656.1 hypothetical protein [Ideonella livida]
MRRILMIATGVTVALTLAACGSKPAKPAEEVAECVFPDAPKVKAPGWICNMPVEGVAVSAIGSHEKSAAGFAFMQDQATAAARVRLAQQMRVHVTNMVKQYAETTGAAGSETVDKVNTSVSKLITVETLSGSRVYRSYTSPTGMVYVLVGLDPKLAEQSTAAALRTSMNNDRAAWQQFRAKKGQDELADDIAKLRGTPAAGQ